MRSVWVALAAEDIGDQHRLTLLGPLWLVVNYLAFVCTFVFLFHSGHTDFNYPAYAATGLFVWFFLMEIITKSLTLFQREAGFIKGTTLPLTVYVMRLFMQSAIRAGYSFIGCAVILYFSGVGPSFFWLWSALGIAMIVLTVPAAIIVFAFIGTFFPDAQYIISNLMRIGMFITPIFWVFEGSSGARHTFYYWNPFTYYLEIVRFPILFHVVRVEDFIVTGSISLGLWLVAILLLGKLRHQVVFML